MFLTATRFPCSFLNACPLPLALFARARFCPSKHTSQLRHTILLALQLVQATGIVDGSTPKPNVESDPDAADIWNYNDIYIKMLIRGHVADSELMHIRSSQTSRQMWDTLQKL